MCLNMFWKLILLILITVISQIRKIRRYIRRQSHKAKYNRYKKELIKEWNEVFPHVILILDDIFEECGLISPWEYLDIFIEKEINMLKSTEQISQLLKHANRMLWRFINHISNNKSIREILRKQIKVVDDEELVFAF